MVKNEVEIIEISERQLDEVIALSKEIWLPAFAPYFDPDELHTLYRGMYDKVKLRFWISAEDNHLYIVKRKNASVGYLGLTQEADRLWLDKIYIHQELQGLGLGSAVLEYVTSLARSNRLERVALRVNRRNQKAIAFYLHKGFTIDGEADYPAPGGYIYDDYLMSKNIS